MATEFPDLKPFDLSSLPERIRASAFDEGKARAMLATIEKNGAASDLKSYESPEKARNAGIRFARALRRVIADGDNRVPTIRTFGIDKAGKPTALPSATVSYGWVISLREKAAGDDAAE